MKRITTKRISVLVAIVAGIATSAAGLVTVVWKVTPSFTRVCQVPDKLDAVAVEVKQTATELAEMRGEVKTIKQMLQTRMLSQHIGTSSTNAWDWPD